MLRPLSGNTSFFLGFEGVPVDCPLVALFRPFPWEDDPSGKDVTHHGCRVSVADVLHVRVDELVSSSIVKEASLGCCYRVQVVPAGI